MANYSEFNNNNYLSGLYNEMAATVFHSFPTTQQYRSPIQSQNSFTFTSPTQGITLATHRPCIQTTSPISNMSAPGMGTSWQHSIPVTMPWADGTNYTGAGTTTVFTGVPVSSFSEIQASISVPTKRPKRKALDFPEEAPMSKVYLCADQFAHMSLTGQEPLGTSSGGDHSSTQVYFGSREIQSQSDADTWQRFRDIENRLEIELDEDLDGNVNNTENVESDGPRLRIVEGILKSAQKQSPILPPKVMEEITKPCMQIVLWKSPGELIREISKDENQAKTSSSSTTNTFTDSCSFKQSANPQQIDKSGLSIDSDMDMSPGSCFINAVLSPLSQPSHATNNFSMMTNRLASALPPSALPISSLSTNIFSSIQNNSGQSFVSIDDDDMQL